MDKTTPIEALRFKMIRDEHGHTQTSFAKLLGIKNIIADLERGKTKITGRIVMQLFKDFGINPMWLFGESDNKTLTAKGISTMPKVITLNDSENENIVMVGQKAAAGYPENIYNNHWYDALPAFGIPLPEYKNATFRAFQVEGDSMLPNLKPGEWLLCKALEDFDLVKSNKLYVIILENGVLVKKVEKIENHQDRITLISLNREYPPQEAKNSMILEMWEVNSKLSFDIDSHISLESGISGLFDSISDLKRDLKDIKKKIDPA